jgi:hypothetical protein
LFFKKGYGIASEVKITPDSVFIEGPARLIQSLPEYVDLKLPDRNIDEDFSEDIEVKFLNDELIKRNPPTVSVAFEVDNYVEIADSVRLKVINPPKNSWPVIGGKKLACTFLIPESLQQTFSSDSLTAIVNLRNITKGERKILPTIVGLSPYSRVLKLDSISIKF